MHVDPIDVGANALETDILIVGAGFAGIGMGIRLKQAGLDNFLILEQSSGLGGTWYNNRYPGCACDIPSHLYSFSFEKNPNWSRSFANQQEILAYLERSADKYGVRPHMRFRRKVASARFDEARGTWSVQTEDGRSYTARVLISASGTLSRPSSPQIPGLSAFRGPTFHTARWREDVGLEGKRVAVIGTGASAVQVIPTIVDKVSHLSVFQRTPGWVLPKLDLAYSAETRAKFAKRPWLQSLLRRFIYWRLELLATGLVLDSKWRKLGELGERAARRFLDEQVRDPALRAKLTPDFRLGCKRVLLSNDYYQALQRQNAELVTSPIETITERGIRTADGTEHELDAIVLATGFQAAEPMAPFALRGLGGRALSDVWRDGAEAYLGTSVAGFPNFFMLVGPNSALGHNSIIFMIESHIAYVLDAIRTLRARSLRSLDVRQRVQDTYNRRIHARLARTVWATGDCHSWYRTRSGKNTTLWPGFTFEFRLRTRRFDPTNYDLEPMPARETAPRAAVSVRQGIVS
jgi:cation diffusion facilitator CzcD-associated flavoprotein CzcO